MLNLADFQLCNTSAYKQVMNMSPSDWFEYINSSTCVICKKPLDELDSWNCEQARWTSFIALLQAREDITR